MNWVWYNSILYGNSFEKYNFLKISITLHNKLRLIERNHFIEPIMGLYWTYKAWGYNDSHDINKKAYEIHVWREKVIIQNLYSLNGLITLTIF